MPGRGRHDVGSVQERRPRAAVLAVASAAVAVEDRRHVQLVTLPQRERPTVTAEEKLFLLFKEDYHARQIFEFLRAATVRDLEQFSAEEIVRKLSQPVRDSVQRIRLRLAKHNRCLRDDLEFALEHGSDE